MVSKSQPRILEQIVAGIAAAFRAESAQLRADLDELRRQIRSRDVAIARLEQIAGVTQGFRLQDDLGCRNGKGLTQ